MRLWSLSPKYLDRQGLLAVWREGLLAKKVLEGKTQGYKNHPQLERFKEQKNPLDQLNLYLQGIYDEALSRGYSFEKSKVGLLKKNIEKIKVNTGQLRYEFEHLLNKLERRDKKRFIELKKLVELEAHPLFQVEAGEVASWEKIK
jgi:predicted nuclease with TOPRIM domain